MLYKSSFETAAQSEMVGALFELYLALMRDVKKGIFYSVYLKFMLVALISLMTSVCKSRLISKGPLQKCSLFALVN